MYKSQSFIICRPRYFWNLSETGATFQAMNDFSLFHINGFSWPQVLLFFVRWSDIAKHKSSFSEKLVNCLFFSMWMTPAWQDCFLLDENKNSDDYNSNSVDDYNSNSCTNGDCNRITSNYYNDNWKTKTSVMTTKTEISALTTSTATTSKNHISHTNSDHYNSYASLVKYDRNCYTNSDNNSNIINGDNNNSKTITSVTTATTGLIMMTTTPTMMTSTASVSMTTAAAAMITGQTQVKVPL